MGHKFFVVLGLALTLPALSASAGPQFACETLVALTLDHSQASEAKAVKHPDASIAQIIAFREALSNIPQQSAVRNIVPIHQQVTHLVNDLHRTKKVLGGDQALVASGVFWGLHSLLTSRDLRAMRQQCEIILHDAKQVHALSPQVSLADYLSLGPVLWGAAILAALAATGALIRHLLMLAALRERQSKRRICQIPVFLHAGTACTKTVIVDISQTGIKVVASRRDPEQKCVGVHFAGQVHKAKEKWRNTRYAGYKFQTPITAAELQAALATDKGDIRNAGIEKTAPACYGLDCEIGCSKHMAPALPLRP